MRRIFVSIIISLCTICTAHAVSPFALDIAYYLTGNNRMTSLPSMPMASIISNRHLHVAAPKIPTPSEPDVPTEPVPDKPDFELGFGGRIPTTKYVQKYLREYTENPDLELNNVSDRKLATEKYIMSAIDFVNGNTNYAAKVSGGRFATMTYMEKELEAKVELCSIPWTGDAPGTMSYVAKDLAWDVYDGKLPDTANGWAAFGYGEWDDENGNRINRYVALAKQSNIVAYSDDGINWTESTLPVSATWSDVAYGGGKFVALASGSSASKYSYNTSVYSYDGITWYTKAMNNSAAWESIAYGNDRFVAVGFNSNKIEVWVDGTDKWENVFTKPSVYTLQSVAYGNGKFVIFGSSTENGMAYSIDGVTWTYKALGFNGGMWTTVGFGNGVFVALAQATSRAAYSFDGETWNEMTMPAARTWTLKYANGYFMAEGDDTIAISENGKDWTKLSPPASGTWILGADEKKFFLLDYNGNRIFAGRIKPNSYNYWIVGNECSVSNGVLSCVSPFVGGDAVCSDAKCTCWRSRLINKSGEYVFNGAPDVAEINRTFADDDACNAQCADICADNVTNNTDGAQMAVLCGK